MEKDFKDFEFLKKYGDKKLISIQSIPQWPENGKHVSDEVTLNFADGSQLVVSSSCENIDTFFDVEEDVVFAIREDTGHEPFCNIGDYKMSSILVDENPESIKVFFDEISYADKSISDKTLVFPVGLFIKTAKRSIGITRDVMIGVWLDANYFNADNNLMYSLDERWDSYEGVDSFIVKRQSKEYISGKVELTEEKQFC